MAPDQQLDAACGSETRLVKSFRLPAFAIAILLSNAVLTFAQQSSESNDRVSATQRLYSEKKWEETARLANGPVTQSAELDYLRGMALMHLERWKEARDAFFAGERKRPQDERFLTERAGAEYRLKDLTSAKKDLQK